MPAGSRDNEADPNNDTVLMHTHASDLYWFDRCIYSYFVSIQIKDPSPNPKSYGLEGFA